MNLGSLCGVNQDFVCLRSAYFRVPGVFLAVSGREIQSGCEKRQSKVTGESSLCVSL